MQAWSTDLTEEIERLAELERAAVELGYAPSFYKAENTIGLPGFSFNLVEVNPEKE
jgi:hypothetical protein